MAVMKKQADKTIKTVSELMTVSINDPALAILNAFKYVISCLNTGRHEALENIAGLLKKAIALKRSEQLFY